MYGVETLQNTLVQIPVHHDDKVQERLHLLFKPWSVVLVQIKDNTESYQGALFKIGGKDVHCGVEEGNGVRAEDLVVGEAIEDLEDRSPEFRDHAGLSGRAGGLHEDATERLKGVGEEVLEFSSVDCGRVEYGGGGGGDVRYKCCSWLCIAAAPHLFRCVRVFHLRPEGGTEEGR